MTLPAAEAALDAMTRHIDQETGARHGRDRKGRVVRLMPAGTVGYATPEQHALVDTFNVVLWALVLSLVCASRVRLVRQFLTESVLLSLAGGLAALAMLACYLPARCAKSDQSAIRRMEPMPPWTSRCILTFASS